MRVRRRRQWLAGAVTVALTGLLGLVITPSASAQAVRPAGIAAKTAAVKTAAAQTARRAQATAHPRGDALPAGVRQVCPTPTRPGLMACLSVIRGNGYTRARPALINPSAYGPADLQGAYDLVAASAQAGKGMTVAIVDAGNDPDAASDLATYRKEWGLPACDAASGAGCVVKVSQDGKTSPLPIADPTGEWEVEESLDLDMVSAICPNCRILLV
ncbi:MAG: peptidase, partial [Actinomycetia bacterium]|nr:peptidase [Actinomycetes bacterium]